MCKYKQIGSIGAHLHVAGRAFSTLCCASLFTYLYSEKGSGKADWLKLFWEETILYQRKQCLSGTSSQRSSKLTGTVPWQKQPAVGQGIAWRWPHRGNKYMAVSPTALLWALPDCPGDKTYHGPAERPLPLRRAHLGARWLSRIFQDGEFGWVLSSSDGGANCWNIGWAKFRCFITGKARCRTKSKTTVKWGAELNWSVKMNLERGF